MNAKIAFRKARANQKDDVIVLKVRPAQRNKIIFSPGAKNGMISKVQTSIELGLEQALRKIGDLPFESGFEVTVLRLVSSGQANDHVFFLNLFLQLFNQPKNVPSGVVITALTPFPEHQMPKFSSMKK